MCTNNSAGPQSRQMMDEGNSIPPFKVIAAMLTENRGIGKDNSLPWPHIREDYEYYLELSSQTSEEGKRCANIKGRASWESTCLDEKTRPTVLNVIVSNTLKESPEHTHNVVRSFPEALKLVSSPPLRDQIEHVWILGGQNIYKEALSHPMCKEVYLTHIYADFPCDTFMPTFENDYILAKNPYKDDDVREDNGLKYRFLRYVRNADKPN